MSKSNNQGQVSSVNRFLLHEIADIYPGYPFRGSLPINPDGEVFVVQFRNVIVNNPLNCPGGEGLDRVDLTGRKPSKYLEPDDVIFMAKSTRNHALAIETVPLNTICSPHFFHIRLKKTAPAILGTFIAWQINHTDAQRYFASCGQGSAARMISKSQLGELPVYVPSIEKQKALVGLSYAAAQEAELLARLIENKQRMIDAIGHQVMHEKPTNFLN